MRSVHRLPIDVDATIQSLPTHDSTVFFPSACVAPLASTMEAMLSLSLWGGFVDMDDVEVGASLAGALSMILSVQARRRSSRISKKRNYRGSVRGRAPNRHRDFALGLQCILRDYFGLDGAPPVYGEKDFERRFRVPRAVFMRIYQAVKDRPYWRQRVNATGKPQSHPLQKLVGAFRVIAYGASYDRCDEYVRLSRSTIAVATKKLMQFIVEEFGPSYLRAPTPAEVQRILTRNAQRGMPGCLGSMDCSHWE